MSRYQRTTRARSTGTHVLTGHADDVGLDRGWSDYDQRDLTLWYNVCDVHGSICGHQTLELAKRFASAPEEWCEECREVAAERHERYQRVLGH